MSEALERVGWNDEVAAAFAPYRDKGFDPARVIGERKGHYLLAGAAGGVRAALAGRLRHRAGSRAELPAVGDWVAVRPTVPGEGVVQAVLPRRNAFSRKVVVSGGRRIGHGASAGLIAGGVTEEQVIAANLDTLFVVTAPDDDFSLRRVERYLTAAHQAGVAPVVVLNKIDLDGGGELLEQLATVAGAAPTHGVSALGAQGVEGLGGYLGRGRTVALVGSSGVGKSTLINRLLGEELLATGATREGDGKGRHTTTWRELVVLPGGALLIDNPGIRELQVWADEEELAAAFADIEALQRACHYRDCSHQGEPGCALSSALESGELDPERYRNYLDIRAELAYLEARKHERRQVEDRHGKVRELHQREAVRVSKRNRRRKR